MNLYQKHRPKLFKEVSGNKETLAKIQSYIENVDSMPRVILFSGESGTGKTTLARLIASKLKIKHNYQETNCADVRGIDHFREMSENMKLSPIGEQYRMIVLDEVHQLPSTTQQCLLKPLEEAKHGTFIILCTTNPEKILKTIITRCVTFKMELLDDKEITDVVNRVLYREKRPSLPPNIISCLVSASGGSARQAISILDSILDLPESQMEKKIKTHENVETKEVIELCRLLLSRNVKSWKSVTAILSKLDADPESIRRQVLGYANSCLLRGNMKAYSVLLSFSSNYYDTGKAGLTMSCYEALNFHE